MEIKSLKVDVTYNRIIDGIVEEISIDDDIYRLVKPETMAETDLEIKKEEPELEHVPKIEPEKEKFDRAPEGAIKHCETYRVWVTKDMIRKVIMAIEHVECDYVPSSDNIQKRTGLSLSRCRATLKFLCDTKRASKRRVMHGPFVFRMNADSININVDTITLKPKLEKDEVPSKGEKVGVFQGINIYKNILEDMKELIERGEGSNVNLKNVIKKYNPDYKDSTLYTSTCLYRNYIKTRLQIPPQINKGKKIGVMKNNVIYENVYSELIKGIGEGKKYPELEKIIEKYYPGSIKSTCHTYVNIYKRWHRKNIEQKSFDHENISLMDDAEGKEKKEITSTDEYNSVKNEVYDPKVISTSESISECLGMPLEKVLKILNVFLERDEIITALKDDNQRIYLPKRIGMIDDE